MAVSRNRLFQVYILRSLVALLSFLLVGLIVYTFFFDERIVRKRDVTSGLQQEVLGALEIEGNKYLVLVNEYELVGRTLGSPIFEIYDVSLRSVVPGVSSYEDIELVEDYVERAGFYFSTADITLNAQCVVKGCSSERENHFVANEFMRKKFEELPIDVKKEFKLIKAIRGHVSMGCKEEGDMLVCGAVISRTSARRTSTRYGSRGGDQFGNVANFVETETLVSKGRELSSYVQIRGSMPFSWTQTPSIGVMNPVFEIEPDDRINKAFIAKHVELLSNLYPEYHLTFLNLINQTSGNRESFPGIKFKQLMDDNKAFKEILYMAYDYHAETFKNEEGWAPELCKKIQKCTFFSNKHNQKSIIRTNCVDCLDRTNAVQSLISKQIIIPQMFSEMQVSSRILPDFTQMMGVFWAKNANAISRQYAGSPALKTDIALKGKRTTKGMFHDLRSSTKRYFNANWFDRIRMRIMKLVYGPDRVEE